MKKEQEIKNCTQQRLCAIRVSVVNQSSDPAQTSVAADWKIARNPLLHIASTVSGYLKILKVKKDYLFYLSCVLVVSSIVLFHINMLMEGFGILLFLVGLIMLIFSRKRVLNKLLFILLFIAIGTIGFLSGSIFQGNKALDKIYISDNVNGRVRIIFSRNCGTIPNQENNWNIINITDNIIIVKRLQESILYRSNYFLVTTNGGKSKLKKISDIKEFDGQPSVIEYNPRHWKNDQVNIHDFLIIKDKSTIRDNESILDSLSHVLISKCK
jgi:hypothetical protein